jgi:excisionase family DNA binding protein
MENLKSIDDRLRNIETLLLSQKIVLNFDELADFTGLSKSYLYKLTSSGGIPCFKPKGKQIYFNRQEIEEWLLQNRKVTNEELSCQASTFVTLNKKGSK